MIMYHFHEDKEEIVKLGKKAKKAVCEFLEALEEAESVEFRRGKMSRRDSRFDYDED